MLLIEGKKYTFFHDSRHKFQTHVFQLEESRHLLVQCKNPTDVCQGSPVRLGTECGTFKGTDQITLVIPSTNSVVYGSGIGITERVAYWYW